MFRSVTDPHLNLDADLSVQESIYRPQSRTALEQKEIERAAARLFSSDDGKKVLGYLQQTTFERALGASSSEAHLRYMEGQRALMAHVLRLIDRGKNP